MSTRPANSASAAATVSVVIPTYKHAGVIEATLRSVFNQTHPPFEVIVINDGSPDETEAVLAPWRERGQIVYLRQENQGQAHARNRGIATAKGTYIALLDDDDLWPSDKLEWQVAVMQDRPGTVMVYGGMAPFYDANELPSMAAAGPDEEVPPSGNALPEFMRRNWIVSPGQTLIQRSVLQAIGGFDTTIWGCDDYDLYIRLAKAGEFQFRQSIALYYRRHAGNASRNFERMYTNMRAVHHKHWGEWPSLGQAWPWIRARWGLQAYTFERFLREAREAYAKGDLQAHRQFVWRAFQIFPPGVIRRTYLRSAFQAMRGR